MSSTNLTITPPTLPVGFCFSTWQDFVNTAIGGATVNFDTTGLTGLLKQDTTPSFTQRGLVWYNTASGHVLVYDNPTGNWVMRHPVPANGAERRLWTGDLTVLQTYDGGNTTAPYGNAAGPFWEQDTAFNGRVPVGVGTLVDVANGIVNIVVNGTGGHNELTLLKANLPADTVDVKTAIIGQSGVTGGGPTPIVGSTYGSDPITVTSAACDATSTLLSGCFYTRGQTLPLGSATPIDSMNPYIGTYVIKRSSRIFWTS